MSRERELRLAALRAVLALCERCPQLPVPPVEGVCVIGDDAAGRAEIARIAAALREAGMAATVHEDRHAVEVTAGRYRAFYCTRDAMAEHDALMSYSANIQPTGPAAVISR